MRNEIQTTSGVAGDLDGGDPEFRRGALKYIFFVEQEQGERE